MNTQDMLTYAVVLFVFAVVTLVAFFTYQEYVSVASPVLSAEANVLLTAQENTFTVLDYSFLALMIGLMISLYLSGHFINTHPAFLIVSLIFLGISLLISAVLSNTFNSLYNGTVMNVTASFMPISTQLMTYLPLILLAGGVLFLVGLYSKSGSSVGDGYQ